MRLVRISDLSEKERKKALEEQQARLEVNRQASEQQRQNANNRFNEMINKQKQDREKERSKVLDSSNNRYVQNLWDQVQFKANINNTSSNSRNAGRVLKNSIGANNNSITDKINSFIYGNNTSTPRENRITTIKENEKNNNSKKSILDSKIEDNDNNNILINTDNKNIIPIKEPTIQGTQEKNDNIWKDIADVANLTKLGITSGSKETLNYVENANENNFNNYKDIRKQQFLTSPNVSEEDKAIAKSQDNLLLKKNGIDTSQKVETNLVKQAIRDSINKDEEEIAERTNRISNKGMKKLADIAPSMGQMIPGTVLNAINPVLGTSYFVTSSGGSYIEDAKKRGMSDEQAFKYGTVMGALEGASESFITGQQVNKISKAFGGKQISKKILDSYGFNMFENAVQEAVMEPAQELTAQFIGGKDKADWGDIGSRMVESGFNGALMGAITNGVTYGLEKSVNVYNKIKNKENVTIQEYKEALQENREKFGNEAVEQGIRQGATETYQELNRINQKQSELQNADNNINQQQSQNNIDTSNMNFEDSARAYNIDANNETIKTVKQALSNREISGRFDASYFNNNNENAIWRTYTDEQGNTKREVIFNPNGNTQDTMQQISIHELTHDLSGTKEFDELKSLVLDRNKTMQGYTEARQSLENTYSQVYDPNSKEFKNLVDEEEVADTLAQKLGDQEFVNSLSTEKPTVFKKIYDWVVDKVNKITGNKIEKVYWEDIKNKFENAYRQAYQGENNQIKYSFVGEKGLNNAIMQEPATYMTIEQGLNRAKQMQKAGTNNESIRQNTGWFQDKNGDWKFEISDKNMKIKDNIKLKENTNYKLGDILEHNTLFTMYPEFKDIDVKFTNIKNAKGSYNRDKNILKLSNNMLNKTNTQKSTEGTIIHEIQHAIQNTENFESGRSTKGSKLAYYNSLGEIEASDTKIRFLNEKYKNKDTHNTPPESSKVQPQHKDLNNYLKNRSLLDKIKDSMYNNSNINNNNGEKNYEYDIKQNYKTNKSKNDYEKMEEVKKKSTRKEYDIETLRDSDQRIWDILNVPTRKLTDKQRQNRLDYLKNIDTSNMKLLEKTKIKSEIRALENGYNSVEEMRTVEKEQEQKAIQEFKNKQEQKIKRQSDTINNSSMQEPENNSEVDNKGRTLSKEQQEYFKNSKVRDEKGNLVTLYHGTPNNFTQFNYDYIGSNGTALGKGFYLTDDKKIAESYAGKNGNIMELYANIEKPLSLDKINITKKEYKKFIEKVNKKTKGQFLSDYGEVNYEGYNTVLNRAMENYNYNQNDVDLIHEVFNTAGLSWEEGFRLLKDTLGYDGVINEHFNGTETKVYVPTLPEQIKKIDNISPTNNKDIRYSTNTKGAWQEFLNNQIGKRGEGKTVQELKLPTKETINNKKVDSYNVLYQDNKQQTTMNLPVSEGGKVRKHYKTIMQSSNTSPEAKAIAKELMGTDTYVPDSNERQLKVADDRIVRNGADNEAVTLATKVKNGDKITAEDIATGERLIEYYSKVGDREKLQDTIQNVALAGTQAGQTVQAMSLINRQTPQGQAVYLSKVIDRMNNDIEKRTKGKGKKFELTPEMLEKITTSSKENLESNIDEVARELANQVPKTTIEKIDSWRYFSMLANPRTHFRNIIGNFSMAGVQGVKNKVAGSLEAIAQKTGMIDKRTKTLKPANMETRRFAKADVDNVISRLNNESKFDTRNLIQQYQRTFKSNLLENTLGKLYNLNSKALEKEDVFGLKRGYRKALADYMTANKLTEADLTAGTREADIQLEKARKYAIEQAQEATFHQQSAMASILNTFENKSTATRLITGAVIPFKKTPINVAKAGASYSPLGLVKSFTIDISNLRKGKINANQYIDNLAKGLTGTGIAAVGYALAQAGVLSASGDDDDQKNQYYQEDRGNQPFSLKIGDKTYSLDWLAPTAIPLFIGAELNYNVNNSNEEQTAEDVLDRVSNGIDAMSSAMNPMIEMSMLSGLASTIKSFSQGDTQVLQNLAINTGKSYINQFFPTLSGQIAKIVDDTERSTTSTKKNAFAKAVDSTGKQILNKIPFASQLLPAKTDVWGNTLKRDSNPLYRGLQQMAFPWTEKSLKSTDVDNAISDLYEETGEKSVLPNTSINKDFTLNGEKYRLTPEEYAEYKRQYGKNSYNLLNGLTSSKEYKSMNNEQKTEAISKVYEYANEKNKVDYANKKKVDIETSSLYNTVTSIEKEGGQGSDYFKYLGRITGIEKSEEKIKILEETNIPLKSKSSIYTNTVGKSDEFYSNVLQESNININEYLKYKNQKFESDKKDDGTLEGKTITNSKKKKVYNYVNNMNITYNQKLLILGKQYKLSDNEQKKLYEYINNIPGQTSKEKLEIFKMYTNNFQIYKNGTMSFK